MGWRCIGELEQSKVLVKNNPFNQQYKIVHLQAQCYDNSNGTHIHHEYKIKRKAVKKSL